ncbi:ADP-heptose--lipooligosaccharide heptosyltransferase II [Arcticibacter svalbardensis MN12-7]|uniref:ADP-heptose--lipooligosaccharide heptosyltransferase II n=1 Tax=Arcticibacter svalbardensis MN12-7 TaxID=1150600 RepID=R9GTA0_9SPHI|nr:glycosyltransferase family 9 protein [Arcticibacter svalbardensis]EOR94941.1 ADP-heptose--lipooligosaccharide heptosyltransferase II [Arcticibacter svalbardensis MN12-7]
MKILIIRFSSIGDIVLTTPVIRCIKQQIPGVEIHYITKKAYESVLQFNPYIDKLHLSSGSVSEAVQLLKPEKFDYIIDLHHNFKTLRIKRALGVPSFSFNKLNIAKFILVHLMINILPPVHIVDRYLNTVSALGVKNDGKGLDYFLGEEYSLEQLLPDSPHSYTGFVIGAQHLTKRLPVHKLISICQLVQSPIVLLGGKEDFNTGEAVVRAAGKHVFNACGKFNLNESAFLVKEAQQIISHDTGLMHIAAAFNKKIISVWGNTIPEFGMYPYLVDEHHAMEVKGLSCRPCSKIGFKKCPRGHFKCMNNQNETAIAAILNA